MKHYQNRREFLASNVFSGCRRVRAFRAHFRAVNPDSKPAILGGEAPKYDSGPVWPFFAGDEIERLTEVFTSRRWNRGGADSPTLVFENDFAAMLGSKFGLAVSSGTTALQTAPGARYRSRRRSYRYSLHLRRYDQQHPRMLRIARLCRRRSGNLPARPRASRQARQRSNASYFARTHRRCACRHGRVPGAWRKTRPARD